MEKLNLPEYKFNLRGEGTRQEIFDAIRKKYVRLTPEEWVRQHFINYLTMHKGYPASLIAVEKKITLNRMTRRPDLVAFNRDGMPLMVIECKAPEVTISQETLDQISRYNSVLKVRYIAVTNGMHHYCCKADPKSPGFSFLKEFPAYTEL